MKPRISSLAAVRLLFAVAGGALLAETVHRPGGLFRLPGGRSRGSSGSGSTRGSSSDSLDARVEWGSRRLAEPAGKPVRFHVVFTRSGAINPRLFALTLRTGP